MPLPMFAIALATSAAAGAAARIGSGIQQKGAYKAQAKAAKAEAADYRLRSTQIAELSREQLAQTLGTIAAIRAGRGLNPDSATAQALERKTIENAYRNEAVARLGELNRASAADAQAAGYSRAAKFALPLAALSAASSVASAGATYFGGR